MFFSKSFIASTLLGLATATEHLGEMPAAVQQSTLLTQVSAPPAVHTPPAAAPMPPAHMAPPMAPPMQHVSSVAAVHTTVLAVHTTTPLAVETPAAPAPPHMAPPAAAPPAAAPSSHMPAAGATVKTHVVKVGGPNGTLIFSPENIVAQPGDLVQFQFNPKNHSVVQSTFDQPCIPIQNIMPNKTDAFFSGFMPTNASAVAAGSILTYTIRVMDTKPIWYYCSQGKHCQAGMVGAINAPASGNKTMSAFKGLAAVAVENLSPGQQPGQGAAGQPPAAGTPGTPNTPGGGANQTPAGTATPSSPDSPPQVTTSAANRGSYSLLTLGVTLAAAFFLL